MLKKIKVQLSKIKLLVTTYKKLYFIKNRYIRLLSQNFSESLIHDSYINDLTHPNSSVFFGYYDLNPFSLDSSKVLACVASDSNHPPRVNQNLQVGYYDLEMQEKKFFKIGETSAWCWQQGCRLQWFPA